MSLPIDDVLDILRQHKIDGANLTSIAKDLIAAERELKEEKTLTVPKPKGKFVVLVRGDASLKNAVSGGAWILRTKEGDDSSTLLARIQTTVKEQNDSIKRGRASRVIRTFARAMEWLKPKYSKTHGILGVKTKLPVEVIVVEKDNLI